MNIATGIVTAATVVLFAGPAMALAITNTGKDAQTVGIDRGAKEEVLKIGAGKTVTVKGCKDGCGVTGPWGYSKYSVAGDKIEFDGKSEIYR